MKKYTRPELSISKFDVEDIITTSGVMGTGSDAITSYGELYNDQGLTSPVTDDVTNKSVVYFNWN